MTIIVVFLGDTFSNNRIVLVNNREIQGGERGPRTERTGVPSRNNFLNTLFLNRSIFRILHHHNCSYT